MTDTVDIDYNKGLTAVIDGIYVDDNPTANGDGGIDYVIGDVVMLSGTTVVKVTAGSDTPMGVCLENKTIADASDGPLHIMIQGKVQELGLVQAFTVDEAWRQKMNAAGLFVRRQG